MTKTSVYKVSAMTAQAKKVLPIFSSHPFKKKKEINSKTQPKAIQMMLLIMRIERNLRSGWSNILSTNRKRGEKRNFLLISVTGSMGERDYLLSNADVNISTHPSLLEASRAGF